MRPCRDCQFETPGWAPNTVGRSDEKSANSALEQLAAVGSELELHGNTVDWGQENLPNSALEQLAAVGPQLELHANTVGWGEKKSAQFSS